MAERSHVVPDLGAAQRAADVLSSSHAFTGAAQRLAEQLSGNFASAGAAQRLAEQLSGNYASALQRTFDQVSGNFASAGAAQRLAEQLSDNYALTGAAQRLSEQLSDNYASALQRTFDQLSRNLVTDARWTIDGLARAIQTRASIGAVDTENLEESVTSLQQQLAAASQSPEDGARPLGWWLFSRPPLTQIAILLAGLQVLDALTRLAEKATGEEIPDTVQAATTVCFAIAFFFLALMSAQDHD